MRAFGYIRPDEYGDPRPMWIVGEDKILNMVGDAIAKTHGARIATLGNGDVLHIKSPGNYRWWVTVVGLGSYTEVER